MNGGVPGGGPEVGERGGDESMSDSEFMRRRAVMVLYTGAATTVGEVEGEIAEEEAAVSVLGLRRRIVGATGAVPVAVGGERRLGGRREGVGVGVSRPQSGMLGDSRTVFGEQGGESARGRMRANLLSEEDCRDVRPDGHVDAGAVRVRVEVEAEAEVGTGEASRDGGGLKKTGCAVLKERSCAFARAISILSSPARPRLAADDSDDFGDDPPTRALDDAVVSRLARVGSLS